ncbi:diguanylate cyclase, partial [Lactobacillus nasalidis]
IGHCYRYGGDEFLVMRDMADPAIIKDLDRRLRLELEHAQILDLYLTISISVGYAYGTARTPDEIKAMLRLADHNLYQIKRNGRQNTYGSLFQPDYPN